MRLWSNNQLRVVELEKDPSPYFLAYGATGSGKTDCATAGFLNWTNNYVGKAFGLVAKTSLQTEEKVLAACLKYANEYRWGWKRLGTKSFQIGNNRFLLLDGANIAARARIQGLDLAGVFIDEVNQLPYMVMQELENRVRSIHGGKIVMTANPDNPLGWFQKEYINQAEHIGMTIVKLLWPDNPGLPESEKQRILRSSSGAMRRRRVYGEAAPLYGTIYTDFTVDDGPDMEEAFSWYLAVDPADSSTTHVLLIGKFADGYWVYDEWVWNAVRNYQMTHAEQAKKINEWIGNKTIAWAVCDPASPNFREVLQRELNVDVYSALKGPDSVLDGIQHTMAWLAHGDIKVCARCEDLRTEFFTYQWDEKASERGEDKPLKTNDHGMDALRYFCYFNHQPQVDKVFNLS